VAAQEVWARGVTNPILAVVLPTASSNQPPPENGRPQPRLTRLACARLYQTGYPRQSSRTWHFLDSTLPIRNDSGVPWSSAGAARQRRWPTLGGRPAEGVRTARPHTALAKFAPGQPFGAAGRRYDGQQRGGLGRQSQLALKPRPQKIRYGQPRWLIVVSPASEHHKDVVARRCAAANDITVPSNRIRVRNEDAARTGARTNHGLSFAGSIRQCDGEMLSKEEFRDFLLHVGRARRAPIWTHDQLQPKRERKRKDKEPFKCGGTIHAAHLSQRSQ